VLPQLIKQLSDAALLADGQATSRIEHVIGTKRVNSVEEYERQIAPIEKKIGGKIIEEGQEMHLVDGKNPRPAALADAAPSADPCLVDGLEGDTESRSSSQSTQASDQVATHSSYALDPDPDQIGPPGGGSTRVDVPGPTWRHRDS
jgi:hypothetical protein